MQDNTPAKALDPDLSEHSHAHLLNGWRFKTLFITILLSIIGYLLFTLWGGWDNVVAAVKQVGLLGISAALLLSLFNYSLRFLRWQLFLKTLGHAIPWRPSLRIYMSGFALTTTPGKTGEALRGVFLKDYGVPFRKSFGAFFAERFCDLLSVSILASGGLWIYPQIRPVLLIVAALFVFILFAIQKDHWLHGVEKFAKRQLPERFAKTVEFILEMIIAFRTCFSTRIMLAAISLGVIAWTAEAVALYTLLHLLGYQIGLIAAAFIYGFSLVIGGITLLPGGLGGAEVTMLQLLILQGVIPSVAVAITLVIRLTSLWFSVLLGLIALPKKRILWH